MRVLVHVALFIMALPLLTIAKSLTDLDILKDAPPLPTDERQREAFLKDLVVKKVVKRSAGCRNVFSNCACNYYKLKDHCDSKVDRLKNWMRRNCAATCGVCTADPEDFKCNNKYPDQTCDLFVTRGLLKKPRLQYFMACKCPKACGICNMALNSTAEVTPIPEEAFPQDECLKLHNEKRRLHGAADLTWCPKCADFADRVVKALHDANSPLKHTKSAYRTWRVNGRLVVHGENLMYKSPRVDCQTAVESWYEEKDIYNPRRPLVDIETSGHFTQMVWKDTWSVGCAQTQRYFACIYEQAGNWKSTYQFYRNVQA
ncbi:GLIPR2 [Branchiostoma lanceolatum]|uniref:GLIPR2 protein n=1 Tax=Branchiostoma lanceolatum TaxID=7740 RepID=A0A8J9VD70_BRALA|nr:GLIPR2 [Branchiostoma lanceolatum]